ncbi:hypothetical protein [Rhodohalobacter sp. 8-1]|uniref:hypothetical protein n=1 Tax=Rhodohalobacter sp. 8-1 TaxID=3131972 RepID=UPI0030ED76F2
MKNITFSANESLIEEAREKARLENTSLNKRFREWLEQYVRRGNQKEEFQSVMKKLGYAEPGKTFTRDEINER